MNASPSPADASANPEINTPGATVRAPRHVLMVAYHFPPSGGPAVQRSAKFAKYLPEFGYEPIVLTAGEREIGSVHDTSLLDELRNTNIVRCPGWEPWVIRLPRKLKLSPLTTFFLRPDKNVLAWLPSARRMVRRIARQHPLAAVYTSSGPHSNVLLGQRLKRLLGVPWIADFRDPWTDDVLGVWPSRWHYAFECRQERRALADADAIVVVTPTMRDLLVRRYPNWKDKVHLLPNGYDADDFTSAGDAPPPGRLHIGYSGTACEPDFKAEVVRLGPMSRFWSRLFSYRHTPVDFTSYSPIYLFRAVRQLLDRRPEYKGRIQLSFVGWFGPGNRTAVRDLGLDDAVVAHGYCPHRQSVEFLARCDLLFLPTPSYVDGRRDYIYTGKLFEYLASGRPILATVGEGDAKDLIARLQAGWCVPPRDVDGLSELLERLVGQKLSQGIPGCAASDRVRRFERRHLTGQLAGLFDRVLGVTSEGAANTSPTGGS